MDRDIAKNYHMFRSWELPLTEKQQREVQDFMNECEKHHRRWDIQYHTGNVIIVSVETVIEFDVDDDDNPPPVGPEKED